jgi:hypothetical protein
LIVQKKSLFVNVHKCINILFTRNKFYTLYLSNLEPHTHRSIQLIAETVEKGRRENKVSENDNGGGQNYILVHNKGMIDFHVNDLDMLHEHAVTMGFASSGGNLSVRKPPGAKPHMI